ncbi:MAG: hypothetical protein NTZ36_00020 [Candidatus Jorgensenbacteria bacterium]|nr:hypothetical protein [Candidatus Jorgensenbacteria bacterium]
MKLKSYIILFIAIFIPAWSGVGFFANAQTSSVTSTESAVVPQSSTNDFELDIQKLKKDLETGVDIRQMLSEIDFADIKSAGDKYGNNILLEGEKSFVEIKKQINIQVDLESPESYAGESIAGNNNSNPSRGGLDNGTQ